MSSSKGKRKGTAQGDVNVSSKKQKLSSPIKQENLKYYRGKKCRRPTTSHNEFYLVDSSAIDKWAVVVFDGAVRLCVLKEGKAFIIKDFNINGVIHIKDVNKQNAIFGLLFVQTMIHITSLITLREHD